MIEFHVYGDWREQFWHVDWYLYVKTLPPLTATEIDETLDLCNHFDDCAEARESREAA